MKKVLVVLLAMSVLLSLCACGAESAAVQTETKSTDPVFSEDASNEQEPAEVVCDFAVQVSIPAAFTLYMDADMNIIAVESADETAEEIVSQVAVDGKTYQEGMKMILDSALEQGHLSDRGEIVFSMPCEPLSSQLISSLCEPVDQLWMDGKAYPVIDWDIIPEERRELSEPDMFDIQKAEVNGQTIYMDKWSFTNPSSGVTSAIYSYYFEYPNPMIYTDGAFIGSSRDAIRTKVLTFGEDGSWSANYFKDGKEIKYVIYYEGAFTAGAHESWGTDLYFGVNADGSYWFNESENGIMVRSRATSGDGWYGFFEYENDIVINSYTREADGEVIGATFDPNGVQLRSFYLSPDGSRLEQTYYPNGNLHIYEEWLNGMHMRAVYDENGSVLESIQEPWDGTSTGEE